MIGVKNRTNEIHIPHFENDIKEILSQDIDTSFSELDSILKKVKGHYRYIHLPAEADSLDFTKMESTYVQKLLDEDIRKKIKQSISESSINEINKELKSFIEDINNSLEKYTYKGKNKDRLTSNDLIDRIFSAYFGIKVLHKKNSNAETIIKDLSSGEKKQALIDLSYALISRFNKRDYQIVLAIDEPDASMHVAACHDQFEKISKIPTLCDPHPQVLINTHWYGFLPIMQSGNAHSLSKTAEGIDFYSFDLINFREQINQNFKKTSGQYPKEIELKSYQDMIQSVVVSMLREHPYNWIFCEGLSDKIYLSHYLSDLIETKNLRIVPLGGFKYVRRVYTYLTGPLSDKEAGYRGKIICLADSDAQKEDVDLVQSVKKNLLFKRIVRKESPEEIGLVDIDSEHISPLEIELSLRSSIFINLMKSINLHKNLINFKDLEEIYKETNLQKEKADLYDFLNLDVKNKKKIMTNFFDIANNKVEFAKAYVASDPNCVDVPGWISEIRKNLN